MNSLRLRAPMSHPRFRPGCVLAAAAVALLTLTGCQGMTVTGFRESAQVRVVHASPDTPAVDLFMGPNLLAYGVAFGTRTTYVPLEQGSYVLHADAAGTRQALSSASATLTAGGQYTAIVGDSLGNLRLTLLPDQTRPAPAGEAAVRLIDQAFRSGPLDVYLLPSGSGPAAGAVTTGMNFGAVDGYRNVPAGVYRLLVLPAGAPGAASGSLFTGPQMNLVSGSVRSVVLLDRVTTDRATAGGTVQAIVESDGEIPGN